MSYKYNSFLGSSPIGGDPWVDIMFIGKSISRDDRGRMRVVTFKMEEDLLTELDKFVEECRKANRSITRSDIIRKAIIEYMRKKKMEGASDD